MAPGPIFTFLVAAALVIASLTSVAMPASARPDLFLYQVPLPLAPRDGNEAFATMDSRAQTMLAAVACGSELSFAQTFGEAGEDSATIVIAKLEWAAGHPNIRGFPRITDDCHFSRVFLPHEVCPFFAAYTCDKASVDDFAKKSEWRDLREGRFQALNDNLKIRYSPFCQSARGLGRDGVIRASAAANPADPTDTAVRIDFAIDRDCLIGQVNKSLNLMKVAGKMGTDNLCGQGDWDMTLIHLTRIAYLDKRHHYSLLGTPTRQHLHIQLLTADGGPAPESYELYGCGNTEESTGTSQERADERDWIDDVGQAFGDFFEWLLKLLAIIVAIVVAVLLVYVTLGAAAAVIVAVVAVAAGSVAITSSIPETENHLLMINTSKYLKNQFIIGELGTTSDSAEPFVADQLALKEWLLGRFQGFLKNDFIEYNSRPYQRLSSVAVLNIADFSDDAELRMGATLVLDYLAAKFAVGSHQGRRFVPFRRKRDVLRDHILEVPPPSSGLEMFNGLFDQVSAPDYHIGVSLLYAGQTQHLPDGSRASFGAAGTAVPAATSFYAPEPLIVDLAIRKDVAVFQRISHFTSEIYSSGRSFLISAGGTPTDQAYSGSGAEWIDRLIKSDLKNDEGLALPTVLFISNQRIEDGPPVAPPRGSASTTLPDMIRIEGKRPVDPTYPSFGDNLCVWDGFACGMNIVVPARFGPGAGNENCLHKSVLPAAPQWEFIDSAQCASYAQSPRFFIALYRQACPNSDAGCADNFGFLEIVDALAADSFDAFKSKVLAANPPGFVSSNMRGTYKSVRGQTIVFDGGVGSIDTIDGQPDLAVNWPFAGEILATDSFARGDARLPPNTETPLKSNGDGFIEIWNPRLNTRLELDFRNRNNPSRKVR